MYVCTYVRKGVMHYNANYNTVYRFLLLQFNQACVAIKHEIQECITSVASASMVV